MIGMGTQVGFVALLLAASTPLAAQQDLTCPYRGSNPSARKSPLDSVMFQVSGDDVLVCYGRPSARGRTMIGGAEVPFGRIWRTGANETTKIRTTIALDVGGIELDPGTYAIYSVPGEAQWEFVVNRSWEQWGRENYYTDDVRAQEIGRVRVPREQLVERIETFTIRTEPLEDGVNLILEWEQHRIRVPVRARS